MKKITFLFCLLTFNVKAIEVGQKIKNINLPQYKEEKNFSLENVLKKKKVVLNFWASWCTACINELAELEELKKKYQSSYEFFAINAGEKSIKIKKFLKRHNFSYTILLDRNRVLAKTLKIDELPRTLVIDKNFKVIFSSSRPPKSLK